jgi:hypothetical protein
MSGGNLLSYESVQPLSKSIRRLRWLGIGHYFAAVLIALEIPVMFSGFCLWLRFFSSGRHSASFSDFEDVARKTEVLQLCATYGGIALLPAISAWLIARRQLRMISFLIGCVMCLIPPFGTLIGLPTVVLLRRASFKDLYKKQMVDS